MAIRVLSFDFDACLFNNNYLYANDRDVIKHNEKLLRGIKQANAAFTKVYTLVGSNRQSNASDKVNQYKEAFQQKYFLGSCFPAIKRVSEYLGTICDPFLLADIFGNLESGTSFQRAVDPDFKGKHSEWLFDDTKLTILYAQMHKLAMENPKEDIVFDFYDDRGNGHNNLQVDMLEKLHHFFTQYPKLMPANVTLRLNHYAGATVTPYPVIKGAGFIDTNYRQTVKDLALQAVTAERSGMQGRIFIADMAEPERLLHRKPLPATSMQDDLQSRVAFVAALEAMAVKICELEAKGKLLLDSQEEYLNCMSAAKAAHTLYHTLDKAAEAYDVDKDAQKFQTAANKAIKAAEESKLKDHRGSLKLILSYAGLAVLAILSVASIGLAYAIAGGVNYAFNRQFFFSTTINTDSFNRISDLKEAAGHLCAAAA